MKELEEFTLLLSKWPKAYTTVNLSYIALKVHEGVRLLSGQVSLETDASHNEKPFRFETDHIVAARLTKSMEDESIDQVVAKAAETGEIEIFESNLKIEPEQSSTRFSLYLDTFKIPFSPILSVRGISQHGLLTRPGFPRHLDRELQAADTPFDSIDELVQYCGLPAFTQGMNNTLLEIVLQPPATVSENSIVADSKAIIKCQISNALDRTKIKLGWSLIVGDNNKERASAFGDSFEWQSEQGQTVGAHELQLKDAHAVFVFLSYDNILLDRRLLVDPKKTFNSRCAIHQAFDPKTGFLTEMLFKADGDKATVFEGAVSILMNLLGFSVVHYGNISKLRDGPDIIAATPSGCFAIIECTIGPINQKDKIAKLIRRTHLSRKAVTNACFETSDIQPVVFTQLLREEAIVHFADAAKHGVAVVCREDIENLLKQIELPANADQTFTELRKLIPITSLDFGNLNL